MTQQLLEKDTKVEDIENLIPSLAKDGGIDLSELSTKRRHKLISRLRDMEKQPLVAAHRIAHG